MRAKAESGVDTSDYMLQAIDKFAHQFENNHRDARRARIRRQYLEKHNWQWDPNDIDKGQEKTILKRLQDKRFAAGMDEYSDDDEEADQDQSDEDVWEDEEDDSDHEEEEEDEEEDVAEDEEDEGHGEENVLHSV